MALDDPRKRLSNATFSAYYCGYDCRAAQERDARTALSAFHNPYGDGRSFLVKHPDFVSRSHSGRTIIVSTEDDGHSVLDMLLVTELEVHPPAKSGEAA